MSDAEGIEEYPQLVGDGVVGGDEEHPRVSTPHPREHAPLLKPMNDDLDSLQAFSHDEDEDRTQLSLSKLSDVSSVRLDESQQLQELQHFYPAGKHDHRPTDDNSSIDSRNHTGNSVQSEVSKTQIKINYAPVWKPGFQNRRNQSAYLKNAFPAGYHLAKVRAQLSGSHYDHIMKKAEVLGKSSNLSQDKFSFVDWTKGSNSFELSEDDNMSDPYADCAGPLLIELQRARKTLKSPSFDFIPQDPACIVKRLSLKPPPGPKSTGNSSSNKSVGNSTVSTFNLHRTATS